MNNKNAFLFLIVLFFSLGMTSTVSAYATSTIAVGDGPSRIVTLGTKIYTANALDNTVSIIDTADGNSVTNVAVGVSPYVLTTLGTKVYVANRGLFAVPNDGSVSIIDTADGNSVTTIPVDEDAQAIYALGTRVYIGFDNIGYVSAIDPLDGNSVTNITISDNTSAGTIAMVGNAGKLYVANANDPMVSIIDPGDGNSLATTTIGDFASGDMIAIGGKVYVPHYGNAISIIASDNSVTEVATGDSPYAMALLGTTLYVINTGDDTVSIIDTETDTLTGSVSVVTVGSEGYLTDIAVLGSKVFVINSLADNVVIIDTADGNSTESFLVGDNPFDIQVLGSRLYIANNFGDSVTIIEVDGDVVSPTVSVQSPLNNTTVSGPAVLLTATASDDDSVAGVQFKFDGTNIGVEDTAAPYEVIWDTTTVPNGTYTLSVVARDAANNYATSSISITVNNEAVSSPTSSGGSSSGGTSVQSRVRNLYARGDVAAAEALMKRYPRLFPVTVSPEPQSPNVIENASPTSTIIFSQNFGRGETAEDILMLQRYLNQQGFVVSSSGAGSPGSETSYFGPLTQQALAAFQKFHNISPAVGYFGPLTRSFINSQR